MARPLGSARTAAKHARAPALVSAGRRVCVYLVIALIAASTDAGWAGMLLPHLSLSWHKSGRYGREHTDILTEVKIHSWLHSRLGPDLTKASSEDDASDFIVPATGTDDSVVGLELRGEHWSGTALVEMTPDAKASGCKSIRRGQLTYRKDSRPSPSVLSVARGTACWDAEGSIRDRAPEHWGPGSVVWVDFGETSDGPSLLEADVIAELGGLLEP